MFSKAFLKALAERAVSAAALAMLSTIGADDVFNVVDVSWGPTFGIAAGAGLLSLLKGIIASRLGNSGPSLISAETLSTGRHARPDNLAA